MMNNDNEPAGALGGARECGSGRTKGGIYIEVGMSEDGIPLSEFLIDPPRSTIGMGLPHVGVTLIKDPKTDIVHILDIVGSSHYPNAADFWHEGAAMGFSRKVSPGMDFSLLGPGSTITFIHDRALINNPQDLTRYRCPQSRHEHQKEEACVGAIWRCITEGEAIENNLVDPSGLMVKRHLQSTTYGGYRAPDGVEVSYTQAAFLRVPITRIAVVKGQHEENLARASKSHLPVMEVNS